MELKATNMDFQHLVSAISLTHAELAAQACHAVNSLTIRNWLIGLYIQEYEQHGAARAQYGESLMDRLADELQRRAIPRSDARELRRYRLFYTIYLQIWESVTPNCLVQRKSVGKILLLNFPSHISSS